ncbi:hypothetical protein DENSPDRAFT_663416 [Dentipellis sp. KUC8613]|nr:hypothetical protein DENSPDRAFT_663416 [Dentipellis sp. KUC8613]
MQGDGRIGEAAGGGEGRLDSTRSGLSSVCGARPRLFRAPWVLMLTLALVPVPPGFACAGQVMQAVHEHRVPRPLRARVYRIYRHRQPAGIVDVGRGPVRSSRSYSSFGVRFVSCPFVRSRRSRCSCCSSYHLPRSVFFTPSFSPSVRPSIRVSIRLPGHLPPCPQIVNRIVSCRVVVVVVHIRS